MQTKNIIGFALISLVLIACNTDEPNQVTLQNQRYVMDENCFSANQLEETEVVITDTEDYETFENSIRRYFISSCDTTHLPIIDFDSCFFVGKYTQASGCSMNTDCKVLFQADQSLYTYIITVTSIGTCERLNTAFTCAIIPRQSEQINVQMQVEYHQQ